MMHTKQSCSARDELTHCWNLMQSRNAVLAWRLVQIGFVLSFAFSLAGIARAAICYPIGRTPLGIASDGVNIWVTNSTDNNVSVLAANGTPVGARIPVGQLPSGIAFDGTYIWVANSTDNTVVPIRASDRTPVSPVRVGPTPRAIAFD